MIPDEYRSQQPSDPLAQVTQQVVRNILDKAMESGEWDEQPVLFTIHRGILDWGIQLVVIPWDVGQFWRAAPVHVVLEMFTLGVRQTGADAAPYATAPPEGTSVTGVVLLTEGWAAVTPEGTSEADRQAFVDWAAEHSLSEHPWSREVKLVTAVDTAGYATTAQHVRGEPEPDVHTFGGTEALRLGGRVPEALSDLLTALTEKETDHA